MKKKKTKKKKKWYFDFHESVKIITVTVHLEISYKTTIDNKAI
jgi:hypothetical protein